MPLVCENEETHGIVFLVQYLAFISVFDNNGFSLFCGGRSQLVSVRGCILFLNRGSMNLSLYPWNGGYLRMRLFKGGDLPWVNSFLEKKKTSCMSYLWPNNADVEQLLGQRYDFGICIALLDSRTRVLMTHSLYLTSSQKSW